MATLALSRTRNSLWRIVAVMAAAATGLAVYSYLSYVRAQVPVAGRLVSMVVAARDLEAGTVLGRADLATVKHPQKYLPAGSFASASEIAGRRIFVPVFSGEPITARKLGDRGGASSLVPPGTRAYSLSVASGAGLGFMPKPGDRVDVIVTLPQEVLGEATSVTVLRAKLIAAVGAFGADSKPTGKVTSKLGLDAGAAGGLGITLFVTPEEAQRLAMAEALGRITITLAPLQPEEAPAPPPSKPRDLNAK